MQSTQAVVPSKLCNNYLPLSLIVYPLVIIACCWLSAPYSLPSDNPDQNNILVTICCYAFLAIPFVWMAGLVLSPIAIYMCKQQPGQGMWTMALITIFILYCFIYPHFPPVYSKESTN